MNESILRSEDELDCDAHADAVKGRERKKDDDTKFP